MTAPYLFICYAFNSYAELLELNIAQEVEIFEFWQKWQTLDKKCPDSANIKCSSVLAALGTMKRNVHLLSRRTSSRMPSSISAWCCWKMRDGRRRIVYSPLPLSRIPSQPHSSSSSSSSIIIVIIIKQGCRPQRQNFLHGLEQTASMYNWKLPQWLRLQGKGPPVQLVGKKLG